MHAKATAIPKTKDLPDYDDDNDDGDDDERASEMNEVSVVEGNCRRCVLRQSNRRGTFVRFWRPKKRQRELL